MPAKRSKCKAKSESGFGAQATRNRLDMTLRGLTAPDFLVESYQMCSARFVVAVVRSPGRSMRGLIAAIGLLAVSNVPAASAADDFAIAVNGGTAVDLALLPADHPIGTNAAVKLVSLKRAANIPDLTISTFIVDYRPSESAVLHRLPSSAGKTIPTILITAYPDDSVRERALGDGVVCYLTKPFEESDLLACIRSSVNM